MKKIIIVLICIIIAIVGAIIYFTVGESENIPNTPIEESGEEKEKGLADFAEVKPVEIKEKSNTSNRVIDVVYPSIQSFSNKDFQNYVNSQITRVIFAYRDEIKAVVDDETPTTSLYKYSTSFKKYTCGDYLSLVISNDYQTGGIRSNKWKDTYNINVRTERLLELKDIFPANVDYEKEILSEISKQAKNNNYVLMNGAGLQKLNTNQKFYINDEKLYIYFDPAEIAPAAYGELQFEMPFELEAGKFITQK